METNKKAISQEERAVRDADFQKRHLQFNKDLGDLVKKYELTLEAEPFVYRGLLVARPTVSDAKKYTEDKPVEDSKPTADQGGDTKNDGPVETTGTPSTADGGK